VALGILLVWAAATAHPEVPFPRWQRLVGVAATAGYAARLWFL
jgi:hypothetical protein